MLCSVNSASMLYNCHCSTRFRLLTKTESMAITNNGRVVLQDKYIQWLKLCHWAKDANTLCHSKWIILNSDVHSDSLLTVYWLLVLVGFILISIMLTQTLTNSWLFECRTLQTLNLSALFQCVGKCFILWMQVNDQLLDRVKHNIYMRERYMLFRTTHTYDPTPPHPILKICCICVLSF